MKLRFFFALTVAALLSAPLLAQSSFSWRAGDVAARDRVKDRIADRIEGVFDRLGHVADRVERAVDRVTDRIAHRVRVHVDSYVRPNRTAERIEVRVGDHVRSIIEAHIDASAWAFSLEQGDFDTDPCHNFGRRDRDDYYTHCEVREEQLLAGALFVDARPNGGIRIEAWDRNETRVRAIVQAHARTLDAAAALAARVQVQAGSGKVLAIGPGESERGRREWWSVSYRINVPRRTNLELNSVNGAIAITGVTGTQRFETTNGSVTLADLAGSVRGETLNGGLKVALGGSRWEGDGLDIETNNGPVTLSIPDNYSAQLETRTVNGGVRFDYPMTITGELTGRRGISTTLGSGGPSVRVRTTNGRLRIERRDVAR